MIELGPQSRETINIALIGYGRMGKEVEAVARQRGLGVAGKFQSRNNADGKGLTAETLREVDVAVDFSTPSAVLGNIKAIAGCGRNMVVGTTGWNKQLGQARHVVEENGVGLVYASNFSIGVNIFSRIVQEAASLFDAHPEYDAAIRESHHRGKIDSPSGTALSLAEIILRRMSMKNEIITGTTKGTHASNQLQVTSSRVGRVTGKHEVLFDSEYDSVSLVHSAKNRLGFALGAIIAAEWVHGKQGFYTMDDVLSSGNAQ